METGRCLWPLELPAELLGHHKGPEALLVRCMVASEDMDRVDESVTEHSEQLLWLADTDTDPDDMVDALEGSKVVCLQAEASVFASFPFQWRPRGRDPTSSLCRLFQPCGTLGVATSYAGRCFASPRSVRRT